MKFWYKFLFLPILIFALVGCSDDDESVSLSQYKAEDGKVTQLQKHTIGNGVPIIIMGDSFSNSDIVYGKYREATTWALEELFSVHPMKSLRDYFDVYEVTTVSYANESHSTAFSSHFDGRFLTGDNGKAMDYAIKVIGDEKRMDDVTIIILNNEEKYGGSCFMHIIPSSVPGIPKGDAVAFVSLVGNSKKYILLHEAIGHGFAKLADEYEDVGYEPISEADKEMLMGDHDNGYWRNISMDSDVTKTPWADFAADSRYDFEKLGCYEGGEYREKGVYRATEHSMMRDGHVSPYFNVAGRAMIYKRCMNIAYGDSWEFNYENFVKFDLEKAKAEYQAKLKQNTFYSTFQRLGAPPRFVDCVSRFRAVKTTK